VEIEARIAGGENPAKYARQLEELDQTIDAAKQEQKGAREFLAGHSSPGASSYRERFWAAHGGESVPGYQVHHTIPQEFEDIWRLQAGESIHDTKYLRAMEQDAHAEITAAWTNWKRSLDHVPSVDEIQHFADQLEGQFGKKMFHAEDAIPPISKKGSP
jgi:hypothetical protein